MLEATKQKEREALAEIRKIVEGLGENSHIGAAFKGAWEIAEQNIETEWHLSAKEHDQEIDELTKEIEELKDEIGKLTAGNEKLADEIKALMKSNKDLKKENSLKEIEIGELKVEAFHLKISISEKIRSFIETENVLIADMNKMLFGKEN
jgi:predicted  nucleic acid-binding Zn-ribbon protein